VRSCLELGDAVRPRLAGRDEQTASSRCEGRSGQAKAPPAKTRRVVLARGERQDDPGVLASVVAAEVFGLDAAVPCPDRGVADLDIAALFEGLS
jgi:hypothetical protein